MHLFLFLVHSTEHVNWHGENDGGVLLTGDGAQGLEIPDNDNDNDNDDW